MPTNLKELFGQIDIYLFDQLLSGRIHSGMPILDAGCGGGRNLVYFLREGYDVFAVDADPHAVDAVRTLAERLAPATLPRANFQCAAIERMPFADASVDVVLSSAVLHFARDEDQFNAMLDSMWRVLAPRGLLFCRLASSIGIEGKITQIAGRRYLLPDGSERYLVDEALLMRLTQRIGGSLEGPIKTTVVQDQRAMTTWVVRKN
jgi:tellurite methyltransferase